MATITAKMVGDLRAKTGAGMMDCKRALTEANGDIQKAIEMIVNQDFGIKNTSNDLLNELGYLK